MATPDRFDVFLSYARDDDAGQDSAAYDDPARSFMRRLYDYLTAAGLRVWWDKAALPSRGESFTAEIERAIRSCDRVVLVCGPRACGQRETDADGKPTDAWKVEPSDYVTAEWRCAIDACLPVTPILLKGTYALIPAPFAGLHAPDFRDPARFAAAAAELARLLTDPATPLGPVRGVKALPVGHITRQRAFDDARAALIQDSIRAAVISSADPRATAIYGRGGMGKSTLAAALARDCEVRRRYPAGVVWLEITQNPNIQTRQADLADALGDPDRAAYTGPGTDADSGRLRLSRLLAGQRALIILDDVWDHALVGFFPVADTPCRLLITTRSGALAAKIDGADVRLERLSHEEGASLIASRAGGSPSDFAAYTQISAELDGHTLAVALAAARLAKKGPGYAQDILNGLRNPARPFLHLAVDAQDKDLNLEKSLTLSHDALGPTEQARFRALGAFALDSSFDAAALAAVWGMAAGEADLAAEPLVDAELLDFDKESGRFSQHRVLRAYARALLIGAGEDEAVQGRHFAHYAGLHGDYGANNDEDRHLAIEADFANLRAALEWGWAANAEAAVDLAWALDYFMTMRETLATRRAVLEASLRAAEGMDYQFGLANTLRALGDLSVREAALAAARGFYERALPIYEAIGESGGPMNTLINMARMARDNERDIAAAKRLFERALAIADRIPAYRNHPVIQGWRREYAALAGDAPTP